MLRLDYCDDTTIPRIVPLKSGCWLWTGAMNHGGYGRWKERGLDRDRPAHAIVWETLTCDLVPAGHDLDHACQNPPCVNPAHLEPVLPTENGKRVHYRKRPNTKRSCVS